MTGILVAADLHLDQWKHQGRDPLAALTDAEWAALDGLIVAGDLSNAAMRKWPRFLGRLAARMDPARIHVIPGNHDYYGLSLGDDAVLAGLCADHGINLAQEAEVEIRGRRFLCATLWSDFSLPADPARLTDFTRIAGPGGAVLRPADIAALHRHQRDWLAARLAACGGRATVVTHHVPHPALLAKATAEPGAFASDLAGVMRAHPPQAWLFGHAHAAQSLEIAGVACRNVALGLPVHCADPGARLRALILRD
ncbi:metallophosphoesterase [Paracoccus mangrovi]|uniref:Metallophosphoesterase n=1 Tax=Paracoccus mangrovi TaxID=1715645 RepID=A0ABV7R8B4_9RHOB